MADPSVGVGTLRAGWILARLRLLRLSNMLRTRRGMRGARLGQRPRQRSALFVPFLAILLTIGFGSWGASFVRVLEHAIADPALDMAQATIAVVGVARFVLTTYQALLQLASKDVASPDWDVEWLTLFPLPRTAIFTAKLVERTGISWATAIIAGALLGGTAHHFSLPLGAWWIVPVGVLALSLLAGAASLLIETTLRLRCRASTRQSVQAISSVLCAILLAPLFMAQSRPDALRAVALALQTPSMQVVLDLFPSTLLVRALADPTERVRCITALLISTGLWVALALRLTTHQTRAGLSHGGGQLGPRVRTTSIARVTPLAPRWARLTPVQRRDGLLLLRDRNLLVQVVLLPLVIVVQQLLLGGVSRYTAKPQLVGAFVFGTGAYALAFSALQAFVPDGRALWLTLAQPITLARLLREKAHLSLAVALGLAGLLSAVLLASVPEVQPVHFAGLMMAFVGICIYAAVACSLGVFGYDPLALETRQRIKPQFTMLYLTLSSFFGYAIVAESFWNKLVVLVLSLFLALALWQKAQDALPYLFDPSAAPDTPIAVADGVIALMAYFVLQVFFMWMFLLVGVPTAALPFVASAHAAACVGLGSWWLIGRRQRGALPRWFQAPGWLVLSVPLGVACAHAARAYAGWVRPWFELPHQPHEEWHWYFALFAVVVAPLVEEYLFRGLVLTGLLRQLSPTLAILASAALFAIVHPPVSIAPVFVIGLLCAVFATQTASLLPGITLHLAYNATILWLAAAAPLVNLGAPDYQSAMAHAPSGLPCVVYLHGKGGSGAATRATAPMTVTPHGNGRAWGGAVWLYEEEDDYEAMRLQVANAVHSAGCGRIIVHGFSNGGAAAAKLYCRGETFQDTTVGFVIDDPVPDLSVKACRPRRGVGLALYWTSALKQAEPGWKCATEDWTCEGGVTVGIETFARALGTPILRSPRPKHEPIVSPVEVNRWFAD